MMETLVHYNNLFHGPSVLGVLNEQRLSGQMCDTVLVVGDQRYQAHRSVLAASSEYFQSLFTRTEADAPKVVHLDFCEADAFEIVLNYMYSSSLFVDKGSLAAIQELGYSLGIPFLTNIASTKPHVSYCVSRKRLSFSEEDETDSQTRSVIVMTPRSSQQEAPQPPTHYNPQSVNSKATGTSDDAECKSVFQYSSTLKGNSSLSTMIRPQLTSSVSFSDVEIQHIRSQPGCEMGIKEEDPVYHGQSAFQGEHSQTINRSGPFIESLLRRSLSMDSTVPVFSPTPELHGRDQSVVKSASKATGTDTSVHNSISDTSLSPLVLRTKYPGGYDEHATQVDEGVCLKAEPGSPLGEPLEVLRFTIGDTLPVNLKHFQPNIEQEPRAGFDNFGKRKRSADNKRCPFKKSRGLNEHYPSENICHLCNKAFTTNFCLHFQSHISTGHDVGAQEVDRRTSSPSPSPPLIPQITSEHPGPPAVAAKPAQTVPVAVAIAEAPSSPEPGSSSECKGENPEMERQQGSPSPRSRSNSVEQTSGTQDPYTLFYHALTLSALTFKRQYMCKLCHRTFKTAFSLWSHERSHGVICRPPTERALLPGPPYPRTDAT